MKIQRQVMKSEVSAEGNIAVLQGVCRVKSVVVLQNRVVGRKAETQNAGGILSGQPDDTTRVPPCSLVINKCSSVGRASDLKSDCTGSIPVTKNAKRYPWMKVKMP